MHTTRHTEITREEAIDALNRFLSRSLHPVDPEQVRRVKPKRLKRWLRESALRSEQQEHVAAFLKPAVSDPDTVVVLMRAVRLKQPEIIADVALVGIPNSVRAELETDLVVVFGHEAGATGTIDTCRYRRCFRANEGDSGLCVTATQFNKTCPSDECTSDSDCGGGGGSDGPTVLDVLSSL